MLIHKQDEHADPTWDIEDHPTSVLSGLTNDEVAEGMAPVAGKPFIAYVSDHLQEQGIQHFIFALGYKSEAFQDYLSSQPGMSYDLSVETEPLGTGGAIDRGVVHLREDPEAIVRKALDDVALPQRPGAVERSGDDAADGLGQLLGVPGRRHCVMAHVEVDVEVRVFDPVRQVQTHGHLDQPPPERGERVPLHVVRLTISPVGF